MQSVQHPAKKNLVFLTLEDGGGGVEDEQSLQLHPLGFGPLCPNT